MCASVASHFNIICYCYGKPFYKNAILDVTLTETVTVVDINNKVNIDLNTVIIISIDHINTII